MASIVQTDADIAQRIERFRASLSSNLLARDDFIDWSTVNSRLATQRENIEALQIFVDAGDISESALRTELSSNPGIYPLLLDLLAFNSTGPQVEKWGFAQSVQRGSGRIPKIVDQLFYVGLANVLTAGADMTALLKIAEVHKDSIRRRFRSGKKLEQQVRNLVYRAVAAASKRSGSPIRIDAGTLPDVSLRRAFAYVLSLGSRPIAAVATVFQNQSGGRQLRDLSITYPDFQRRLSDHDAALILIADGPGLAEASDRVLGVMFQGVRYPLTLEQCAQGALEEAILDAATADVPPSVDQAALNRLIEERLRAEPAIEAKSLPVDSDQARLALAAYANSRKRAYLTLSPTGDRLEWGNSDWVRRARELRSSFDGARAVELLAAMLSTKVDRSAAGSSDFTAELIAPPVQPFSDRFHVTASPSKLTQDVAREVGRRSMEQAPLSALAIYLTVNGLSQEEVQQHRKEQIFLPANIIVVGVDLLEQMAAQQRPLDRLMTSILNQSDLTKVSPFILSNPTTPRMFYGRESEAATVQRTLASNSVAILGSRRIGKTSLIRRLREELRNSNFQPYFADCQTVRTWQDFADLARRAWDVELSGDFKPSHLDDLIGQLQDRGDGQVVLILDEIDQLIDWDQQHEEDLVPEAFFRSCRAISQAGAAQFVFSGERRIAYRLWDAQSPHWNFCRALQLTQLDRPDAISLLTEPLRTMNIRLVDPDAIADLTWERTSGHPQIVQFLGDRLVRSLNERTDRTDLAISADDIVQVTGTTEFAQHYLTTYWGQATRLEKDISEAIASFEAKPADILLHLQRHGVEADNEAVLRAVQMLQLYGIVSDTGEKLTLRAEWFPSALAHFGSLLNQ